MKNFKKHSFVMALLLAAASFSMLQSCKPDPIEPDDNHEHEIITTLRIKFTDSADAGNTFTAVFSDPDGEGGNAPERHDTIRLQANKTYFASVQVIDESHGHAHDLTHDIEEEGDEHLFVYHVNHAGVAIEILDKDSKNLPLGLESKWRTGQSSNGSVRVILKHQPGVKDGSEAPGETDIDVTFQTVVN